MGILPTLEEEELCRCLAVNSRRGAVDTAEEEVVSDDRVEAVDGNGGKW